MKQIVTTCIVLARTDYGEADRILTLLTPEYGKLRLMAHGVRRVKSKLAGGIELFSISDIVFARGRGELGTLVSARLVKYHRHIVEDIEHTMLGYDLIKQLNKATEDQPEASYFALLQLAFEALDDSVISLELIRSWFAAQLLTLGGNNPNLESDDNGVKLKASTNYNFNAESMAFASAEQGRFSANHIKFLRILFSATRPKTLNNVQDLTSILPAVAPLVDTMLKTYVRV